MKKKFLNLPRRQKQAIAAFADLFFVPFSLAVALALHLDGLAPSALGEYVPLLLASPVICVPVFVRVGLYRAVIRDFVGDISSCKARRCLFSYPLCNLRFELSPVFAGEPFRCTWVLLG
jgi:FlaA1/EpsC-like NDP-sugar epimerase